MANDNRGGQTQMRQNEVVSAEQKLHAVLEELDARGEELAGVLPRDVTLTAFLANVNQALRANPKLLRCTFASIVNACVKAAYDGLRIDGKEAAIVDSVERYQEGGAWKERMVARYMPMVFGLIKQILQSGAALTVKAVIVYSIELTTINPVDGKPHFMLLEGTTPGIHHAPILIGNKGEPVGCYAIAEVQRGVFKFEWMDRIAIEDVQKEAKTDKVWKRWPMEMWKKTVIRRLRKSLSGTSDIRDMEARDMFAQFDRTQAHPQLAAAATSPRPTRAALTDRAGTEAGQPLNFGEARERETVTIDQSNGDQQQQQRQTAPAATEPEVELPANDGEWRIWEADVEAKLNAATSGESLDAEWQRHQPVFRHASGPLKDRLVALLTDRNADLALDATAGAGAGGGD